MNDLTVKDLKVLLDNADEDAVICVADESGEKVALKVTQVIAIANTGTISNAICFNYKVKDIEEKSGYRYKIIYDHPKMTQRIHVALLEEAIRKEKEDLENKEKQLEEIKKKLNIN